MKKSDIIKGNITIAEFLDMKSLGSYYIDGKYYVDYELKFHTDFSLLMRAVEKIEKIQLSSPSMIPVKVIIVGNSCRISNGTWNESIEGFISYVSYPDNKIQYTKIEATFLAVVEFIEFYKLQKGS